MDFLQKYAEWVRSGAPDQPGHELVESAIEWLKSEDRPNLSYVEPGYHFDCEIGFDDMRLVPSIAFSVRTESIHFFKPADFISSNFISVQNKELAEVLNSLVKNHLGLV